MKKSELQKIIRKEVENVISEGHSEYQNYMFFQNLKTIRRMVDKMMQLDPSQVDALLSSGHGWAVDHISTSADDITEVSGWLCNELSM